MAGAVDCFGEERNEIAVGEAAESMAISHIRDACGFGQTPEFAKWMDEATIEAVAKLTLSETPICGWRRKKKRIDALWPTPTTNFANQTPLMLLPLAPPPGQPACQLYRRSAPLSLISPLMTLQ